MTSGWESILKRPTCPRRNEAKLLPVLATTAPAEVNPPLKMLVNWKFPVGLGG